MFHPRRQLGEATEPPPQREASEEVEPLRVHSKKAIELKAQAGRWSGGLGGWLVEGHWEKKNRKCF